MAKEIERKFLVNGSEWKNLAKGTEYRQGYLSTVKERTVRVRIIDSAGYLTIKGISAGATRLEYEYEISVSDAHEILDKLCEGRLIEKKRYKIEYGGLVWEVDEFFGENEGLVIAEVELEDENQEIRKPEWIGEEITGEPRFFNSTLSKTPYKKW